MQVNIIGYEPSRELEWLDIHASVMVDSAAWWIVLHRKPGYPQPIVDLIATVDDKIVGFIVIEISPEIISEINPAGFVWEFGVHRDYRGHDIGKMLINKAHKIMNREHEVNKSIWYSQDARAQSYYRKLRMKEIGRHWQFSLKPGKDLKKVLKEDGFDCWNLRGSCSIEDFARAKINFDVIEDNETLKPRICIGFEYIK